MSIQKQTRHAPPTFLVEGCTGPKPEWRGSCALAVASVTRRLAMYPYAREQWDAAVDEKVAAAAHGLEHGGRVAVFSEVSMVQPYEPSDMTVWLAMQKAGIEPRCSMRWVDAAWTAELPEGIKAWQSPHDPPCHSFSVMITLGQVGSRAREPDPFRRAKLGMAHRSTISAREWQRDTHDVWTAEMQPAWTDGGLPYEAVRRLVGLHTYEDDQVLILGASASAGLAALYCGRSCLIAADSEDQARRVAFDIAARDGEEPG